MELKKYRSTVFKAQKMWNVRSGRRWGEGGKRRRGGRKRQFVFCPNMRGRKKEEVQLASVSKSQRSCFFSSRESRSRPNFSYWIRQADEFYVVQKCRSAEFEAFKLWNLRSWGKIYRVEAVSSEMLFNCCSLFLSYCPFLCVSVQKNCIVFC